MSGGQKCQNNTAAETGAETAAETGAETGADTFECFLFSGFYKLGFSRLQVFLLQ